MRSLLLASVALAGLTATPAFADHLPHLNRAGCLTHVFVPFYHAVPEGKVNCPSAPLVTETGGAADPLPKHSDPIPPYEPPVDDDPIDPPDEDPEDPIDPEDPVDPVDPPEDEDDHDNGHGNDEDHDDESNPGQGGGNHGTPKPPKPPKGH